MKFTETRKDGALVSSMIELSWEEYQSALTAAMHNSDHGKTMSATSGMKIAKIREVPSKHDRMKPDGVEVLFIRAKERG